MHHNVHSSIIYRAKIWKQPKCPSTDEWIKKMWCMCVCVHTHIHIQMEYYSAIKKNEILSLAVTRIELEGIMLNEISRTEKDKYCILSLICGI